MASQNGESSRATSAQASARINAERSSEPSFLQSLLKEVEEGRPNSHGTFNQTSHAPTGHTTPGPSSPSISPGSSNHSSPNIPPRSLSPLDRRSISPIQLASPAACSSPPFSPDVSPAGSQDQTPVRNSGRAPRSASRTTRNRANDTSPSRPGLSLTVKSEIQKMVGTALKPHYRARGVSKDQYTDINRTISRKLYDQAGDVETLEPDLRTNLEKTAREEVRSAVEALRRNRRAGDSDEASSS